MILDVPFTLAEVNEAVKRLKLRKASGLDGLQPEHLRFGGQSLLLWVQQICNSIIEFEVIPDCLKLGIVCPIYKGCGRNPLDTNSFSLINLRSCKGFGASIPI